jgi:peptide/nickel transport system permease protein
VLRTVFSRTIQGVAVIVITAAIALAIPRWARPDLYAGETGLDGLVDAMRRALLHLDYGVACGWSGCPSVHEMWVRGYVADISMLLGTVAIGVGGGFYLGLWCAGRQGTRRAAAIQGLATLLYCAPVYVTGWLTLLLFQGTFGKFPVPYFFDAAPVWASPFSSPWDWFRTMLVPWLLAAAPLAAMCLRLVVALVREQLESDAVRTAIAKGVPGRRVVRRHAGPYARSATASLVGVSAPIVVLNLILVEHLYSVPGFFQHTWRASGHTDAPHRWPAFIDFPMLTGLAVWGSVFVVLLSFAMDFALLRLDPRVRRAATRVA